MTDDAIAQLNVTKHSTISLYLTNRALLYIAFSVTYSEICQNFSNSVGGNIPTLHLHTVQDASASTGPDGSYSYYFSFPRFANPLFSRFGAVSLTVWLLAIRAEKSECYCACAFYLNPDEDNAGGITGGQLLVGLVPFDQGHLQHSQ